MHKDYIGDGVYVELMNGYAIKLSTQRLTPDAEHWIVLEPEVYAALLRYVARLKELGEAADFPA